MNLLTKLTKRSDSADEIAQQATDKGEALVAAGTAPYEETTRDGFAFHVKSTSAIAGVTAIPTTGANIGLFNNAADGGKSMIIDAIWAILIVAEGTLGQCGLIYAVGQTRVSALTSAFTVRKSNGYGTASTICIAATGGSILNADPGTTSAWMATGETANITVHTLPGVILFAPINGRVIIPPGRQFGINIMSNHVNNTFISGAMWHEKVLKLG